MDELIERLERANTTLLDMAEAAKRKSDYDNQWRLEAKANGVRLALSYAREQAVVDDDLDSLRDSRLTALPNLGGLAEIAFDLGVAGDAVAEIVR